MKEVLGSEVERFGIEQKTAEQQNTEFDVGRSMFICFFFD